jgi:leucyl aminopeptidase
MNTTLVRQALSEVPAQWVVLGIHENEAEPPAQVRGTALAEIITRLVTRKDFKGGLGDLVPLFDVPGLAAEAVLLVGLGARDRFDAGAAYSAGLALAKRLAGQPRASVAVALADCAENPPLTSALVSGAIAGMRSPGLRKTEPNRHEFGALCVVAPPELGDEKADPLGKALRRAEIVGESVNLARELANTPPRDKTPAKLAHRMREIASAAGIGTELWDEARIGEEHFGGLLGVAAGSDEPPRFLILDYRNAGDAPVLALVGKGVTFDSGGLCLKPAGSMEDMKSDMTGAAIVIASMQAIGRLALPVNVRGYIALTENMTGGKALKLGDVLTMRNGKTVEVMNTDAEGRLILADALSYAVEHQPSRVLDLATLTGSCVVALGTKIAGLFGNDDSFCSDILAACTSAGERAWRLPIDDDFKDQLKSDVADIKNVGGKWGGAITAAKFLQQFVASTPWVHLDIAGPSWSDSENSQRDAGATGCFVRTLVALLEQTVP